MHKNGIHSAAACFPVSSDHRFFIKKIHIDMEKINKIIQLFAVLDTEERKAAAGMVRMADLLLDRLDQHGEIPVSSIRKISSSNKNTVTVLEWMGFQLVTSFRASKKPGRKPMAWRKQNGHEDI